MDTLDKISFHLWGNEVAFPELKKVVKVHSSDLHNSGYFLSDGKIPGTYRNMWQRFDNYASLDVNIQHVASKEPLWAALESFKTEAKASKLADEIKQQIIISVDTLFEALDRRINPRLYENTWRFVRNRLVDGEFICNLNCKADLLPLPGSQVVDLCTGNVRDLLPDDGFSVCTAVDYKRGTVLYT